MGGLREPGLYGNTRYRHCDPTSGMGVLRGPFRVRASPLLSHPWASYIMTTSGAKNSNAHIPFYLFCKYLIYLCLAYSKCVNPQIRLNCGGNSATGIEESHHWSPL